MKRRLKDIVGAAFITQPVGVPVKEHGKDYNVSIEI